MARLRVALLVLTAVVCFVPAPLVPVTSAQGQRAGSEITLTLSAESAVLMEPASGKALFEKDSHKRLAPASITKIMTMLIVMEAVDSGRASLEDRVVASPEACRKGGSQIWLEPGEEMSLSDMMKAIAVVSANDCSAAVAEHMAGSEQAFVDLMNQRAAELGMRDTYFANCTGLPATQPGVQDTYTSAYDIALMSRELVRHPKVHEWFSIWMDHLRGGKSILVNTNKLVRFYKGADGLKTGYTEQARYCLSATAKRDSLRLIAVVMGVKDSATRFAEASKLLDTGFATYTGVQLAEQGQQVGEVEVAKGVAEKVAVLAASPLVVAVRRGRQSGVTSRLLPDPVIAAPVKKGQAVGRLAAYLDGEEIASIPVVAAEDVNRGSIFRIAFRITRDLLKVLFREKGGSP